MSFTVKDSGQRKTFDSGMVRDTNEGKTLFHLVFSGPMFNRWAEHMTKGAKKYDEDNWMKASGEAELKRFRESALRHFIQWFRGDTDEDHAAAVFFNINGAEYVKGKMTADKPEPRPIKYTTAFARTGKVWFKRGGLIWIQDHPSVEARHDETMTVAYFDHSIHMGRMILAEVQ